MLAATRKAETTMTPTAGHGPERNGARRIKTSPPMTETIPPKRWVFCQTVSLAMLHRDKDQSAYSRIHNDPLVGSLPIVPLTSRRQQKQRIGHETDERRKQKHIFAPHAVNLSRGVPVNGNPIRREDQEDGRSNDADQHHGVQNRIQLFHRFPLAIPSATATLHQARRR